MAKGKTERGEKAKKEKMAKKKKKKEKRDKKEKRAEKKKETDDVVRSGGAFYYRDVAFHPEDDKDIVPEEDHNKRASEPFVDFLGSKATNDGGLRALRKKRKKRDFFNEEYFAERHNSGHFKRIFHKVSANGQRLDLDDALKDVVDTPKANVDSPEAVSLMMETVAYLVNTVFLFCQGMLAGVALLHIYLTFQSQDDAFFLKVYAPSAGQVRRMFFLLSVASFVGACEKLSHEHRNRDAWRRRSVSERIEIVSFCGLYLLSLLFTLLSTPTDDAMYHTNEFERVENPEWFKAATDGSGDVHSDWGDWTGKLARWRVFVVVRFFCALISWILLCKDLHRDLSRGRLYKLQLIACTTDLDAANMRFVRMCGRGIEELDLPQLEELRRLQQRGLAESDRVYNQYLTTYHRQ